MDPDFYLPGIKHYPEEANGQTLVAMQIESLEALDNVAAIAAVKGIDVLFIGPGDLCLWLGCPLNMAEPKLQAAQKLVSAAAAKHGIFWGRPTGTPEDMAQLINQGARFIAHGSDFDSIAFSVKNRYRTMFESALALCGMNSAEAKTDFERPRPTVIAATAKSY